MFREGMEKSIKEKEINLTKEWRSRNIADLGIHVKDYLSSYSNNADADIEYVDKLIADSHLNPNNTEKNSRALLKLVKKCDQHPHQLAEQEATKPGRQRGICFILKQCKK
jgi:hypothetical protein